VSTNRARPRVHACIFVVVLLASPLAPEARGQQRPLVTEDPETVGAGAILIETGFDYDWDVEFTVSGLTGDLLRFPTIGTSVGVGPFTEIQVDTGLHQRLAITSREPAPLSPLLDIDGNLTSSIEDLLIATKIRIVPEARRRPAMGARFGTRLPLATNESGLGLETLDFFAAFLIGKTMAETRVVGNIGIGLLSDPTVAGRQNEMLNYGVSFARAILTGLELVGEVDGRTDFRSEEPFPGAETRAVFRIGSRYTRGSGRIDGGVLVGITSRYPSVGITVGFTYVFAAFGAP
jgi:hypothetical protein